MRKTDLSRLQSREALAGTLLALSVFVAAVLATRLPATRPLSTGWMFVVAIVLGGMCTAGTHLLLTCGRSPISLRLLIALFSAGTATVGILATASTGSAASFAGGCLLSLLILGGSVAMAVRNEDADTFAGSSEQSPSVSAFASSMGTTPPATVAEPDPGIAESSPENVDQSWRRWHENNEDVLEGSVRVAFEPGQATAIVHIPVQPAMAACPQVECEPVEDSPIRISADPIFPYGVRLVCRRSEGVGQSLVTMVSVMISSPISAARAA
jgi:hypothetical protein